jgi:SynChlorMet cassette radical SAM/SPASM protein ScmF
MGCEPELTSKIAKPTKAHRLDLPPGVPPLTSLYMYIAGSCNLACRHCWIEPDYQADNRKGKFIKLEYVKKAIKEAKPLGLRTVKLTGGEPMLHPKFKNIVDYIDSQEIGIVMETNGTLINDGMAKFLKQKKFFNFVSVSVDGAKSETHDKMRGVRGSQKKVISGIRSLVEYGFKPQIICTLHKNNVSEMEAIIKMATDLGCGSVKFNHIQKIGRGESLFPNIGLTVKEIIPLYKKIGRDFKAKYPIQIHFDIPLAFFSIDELLKSSISRCAVKNILGILSGGEMALCGIGVTIPELVFGRIGIDPIKDVWANHDFLKKLRSEIPSGLKGICKNCLFRELCIGCCIANNYHQSGKITSSYYFCKEADKMGLFPSGKNATN